MIEGIVIGLIAGWFAASLFYQSSLQEYRNRVQYLQDTLNMCNDKDD